MNFGGGVSIPQDKEEVQIMGSWIPITPEKPIPARSHPIPVDGRGNWQELAGFSDGYAEEIPNCNGFGQNLNPIDQVVQNGGFYGCDGGGLPERNRVINHIAGSYTQAFNNDDSAAWKNNPLAKLLLMQNSTFLATANVGMNTSLNMAANRPLIPNTHSPVAVNRKDFVSGGLLLNNQNQYSRFNPMSNLANEPLIPNMHSQVDGNHRRDSNLGSLLMRSQNHYSGSNSLSNSDILSQIPQRK